MNMITSLFSSFDPIGGWISLNFSVLFFIFFSPIIILKFSSITRMLKNYFNTQTFLRSEIRASISSLNKKGKINIITTLFFMILILNLIGLTPYVFTLTAHMLFTLSIALPLWLGFLLFRITKNRQNFLRHLVPLSTPLALSQFIVLIERVRQLIRPITLSVRLAANITAGHILIALCSSNINILRAFRAALWILVLLETAVAFIQRYVFTVLLSMYINEAYDIPISPLSFSFPKAVTYPSKPKSKKIPN